MKKILFTLIYIMSINMANAQIVNIPDANFKAALVNNLFINTNADAEIQVTEAVAYNGVMNVSNLNITDLTGIEAFTALAGLNCSYNNPLLSFNVSANTSLTYLSCSTTSLSSLNVSANTALTYLDCSINPLASLDISTNTALDTLICSSSLLTSLNVSANMALHFLWCNNNQLTSLDVSANPALTDLNCYYNQLTSLDVSANTGLTKLYCNNNLLTSLNVSTNTTLTVLYCHNNAIASLDLTADTALTDFICFQNQLTSLNIRNGHNTSITTFNATFNPSLTCIEVDNVAYSNANWSAGKDAAASYSTNCGVTSVSDIGNIATVQIVPNPANGFVTINGLNNIQKIELVNMQGQIIKTILVNGNSSLIDVSSITNGIYLLKLSSSNQSQIARLVVQH